MDTAIRTEINFDDFSRSDDNLRLYNYTHARIEWSNLFYSLRLSLSPLPPTLSSHPFVFPGLGQKIGLSYFERVAWRTVVKTSPAATLLVRTRRAAILS